MVYIRSHLLSTEHCPVLTDSYVGKLSIASLKLRGLMYLYSFFFNKYPLQLNTKCLQFIYMAKKKNRGVGGINPKQDT